MAGICARGRRSESDMAFAGENQAKAVTDALTLLSIGASVTLRRLGYKCISFWIQFAGPVVFALLILIVNP